MVALLISWPMLIEAQETTWRDLTINYKVLLLQGRYEEALDKAKKALEIAETTFGSEHVSVEKSLKNLAFAYDRLG